MSMTISEMRDGSLDGSKVPGRAVVIDWVADATGDAGSVPVLVSGKLTDIVTTATCDVGLVDVDGVDLLDGGGDALNGRVVADPSPKIIGGLTASVSGADASATGVLVIYVG